MKYLNAGLIPIVAGLAIGILAAATIIDTDPPILGWLLGLGLGLMGGAFLAAIAGGDALLGGPRPGGGASTHRGRRGRNPAPWLDPDPSEDDDER